MGKIIFVCFFKRPELNIGGLKLLHSLVKFCGLSTTIILNAFNCSYIYPFLIPDKVINMPF